MSDEIDDFEQTLRHRDARTKILIGVFALVVAAACVVGAIGTYLLVFVILRDAENTVRIPTVAFWGFPLGAFVFAAAGFRSLRDGMRQRRSALAFDERRPG